MKCLCISTSDKDSEADCCGAPQGMKFEFSEGEAFCIVIKPLKQGAEKTARKTRGSGKTNKKAQKGRARKTTTKRKGAGK